MLLSCPIKVLYTPIPNNFTSILSVFVRLSNATNIIGISSPEELEASSEMLSNFSKIKLSIVS